MMMMMMMMMQDTVWDFFLKTDKFITEPQTFSHTYAQMAKVHSCVHHVQHIVKHVVCHTVQLDSWAIKLSRAETALILALFRGWNH